MKISYIKFLLCCGLAIMVQPLSNAENIAGLQMKIQNAPQDHPRLFLKQNEIPALKEKIAADPLLQGTLDYLIGCADALESVPPLERVLEGRRLLDVSRSSLQRVSYLAFAHLMTGDNKYLERAEQEMLAVAKFEDWNPSHFLDVAEMTAALAIGYDWLYNGLSPESREIIREAILEKGLRCSQRSDISNWWIMTANNWNQVCHGGLTLGALVVLEDAPELAGEIIERAIKSVPTAMKEYEPDGVYPEGASYWTYGTTYNVLLISSLESVLGSDFGLADANGFMKSPEFYLRVTGPTGLFYNFSDCGSRGGVSPAMHWFASRLDKASLLLNEKKELAEFVKQTPNANGSDRTLPFLLIWGKPLTGIEAPEQLNWKGDGRTPVAMLRTGWEDTSTFVGIKGGSPGSNHAHMDIGSFVLDMNGVRWAVDLGAQSYNSLESKGVDLWNRSQDSERWTVFRLNNFSHNTLVVDGKVQLVKGMSSITEFSAEENNVHAAVDMTPVYKGQLKEAKRSVQLKDDSVELLDEVESLSQATQIRWGMVTLAEVEVSPEKNKAILTQNGQKVILQVSTLEDVKITVHDLEKPVQEYDAPNPNTRMIAFEVSLPPDTKENIRVTFNAGTEK